MTKIGLTQEEVQTISKLAPGGEEGGCELEVLDHAPGQLGWLELTRVINSDGRWRQVFRISPNGGYEKVFEERAR